MKKWQIKRRRDRLAQEIYFKDHLLCEVCGAPAVDVHEIVFRSRGGKCVPENMISLCRQCHLRAHFRLKPYLHKEELFKFKKKED